MKKPCIGLLAASLLLLCGSAATAQRSCGTTEYIKKLELQDPEYAARQAQDNALIEQWTQENANNKSASAVITIPVVVHVVYRTASENISDAQILSQLATLNQDFRKTNADASTIPAPFQGVAADTEIEFCLAKTDPNGQPTTGITRTQTTVASFIDDDRVKYDAQGGKNAWDASKYLNIWVCKTDLLGYAQFPSGNPATDGVVIAHDAFGNTGTASFPYNKGRTATHEIGHWLNLRHIWGDSNCGNDFVADTPSQQNENYGCKVFPYRANSCGASNANGDMFMNYMDYSDDRCLTMFSNGQKARMVAVMNSTRSALKNSTACNTVSAANEYVMPASWVNLYPNPSAGEVEISISDEAGKGTVSVVVYDQLGRRVLNATAAQGQKEVKLDMGRFSNGMYVAEISCGESVARRSFALNR